MKPPVRGEVWIVDLGLAAKVRPALVLSDILPALGQRDDVSAARRYGSRPRYVGAHTTSLRGSRFEVQVRVPFLKPGGFDAQGLVTVPFVRLVRSIGQLKQADVSLVEQAVCRWLGIRPVAASAG